VSRPPALFVLPLLLLAACPGPTPALDGGADFQRLGDSLSCQPNNDGVIDVAELKFLPNLSASYLVNPPGTLVDVDLEGAIVGGVREWDFSSTAGNVATVDVEPVDKLWFASRFPSATFALGSDVKAETLQVFRIEQDRLLLLGIASRKPDVTLMIYDTPILSLRFPLREGDSFDAKSTVTNGKLNGLPIATEDTYSVKIDAAGTVRLPFVKLQRSLRLRIVVTSKAVGGVSATVRQAQWFHECYGEVVRAVSQRDEAKDGFTKSVELRRLSF
jgi:hypothetical protein